MDKITWQKAGVLLTILVLSTGSYTYTDLFGVLFQLKGIEANYTGDIICGSECESYINLNTSYWTICFSHYNDTRYENETLFKKVSRSRTLHANLDKVSNIITTQRLLQNGSYEYYDIEVDWLVPARGKGNWRAIEDGDCWDRKKVNKIKLLGHKNPEDTIKWSFGLEDYVDIDPLWIANETTKINGTIDLNETSYINGTIGLNETNVSYVKVDKKILKNPYGLNLSKDNIDSYMNLTTNTCYSETDNMIIMVDDCHQNYAKQLKYNVTMINKQDKYLFYKFMVSSENNINDSLIGKRVVDFIENDKVGKTNDKFYDLNTYTFKPNETIKFEYTINPKETSGKFNFIGYDSYMTLLSAIKSKKYIFLDPTWSDGQVSYWNLDTDGSVPDSWGSNTGTIDGATYTASGKINGAYDFDGINDIITVSNFPEYTNAFTIVTWVYFNEVDTNIQFNRVFQYGTGATDKSWMICSYAATNTWAYGLWGRIHSGTGITITTDVWHHVALTWDGTNQRFYLNGELNGTKTASPALDSTVPLTFGAYSGGSWLNGSIDEAAFFNKTLNLTEIDDIYNNGLGEDVFAPTYAHNSTNTTIVGTDILHSLRLNDNIALDTYIFSFDNGSGTLVNDSLVDISGTLNWSNVTKGVNHTIDSTIRWQVFANDTSDNWVDSPIYSYNLLGRMQGTAKDKDTASAIVDATVWIIDASDNSTVGTTSTDASGNWHYDVSKGTYHAICSKNSTYQGEIFNDITVA